jgi:putative dimethyl sulfoxide reductase chaperone
MSTSEALMVTDLQAETLSRQGMYRLLAHLYREEIDTEFLQRFELDGSLKALQTAGLDLEVSGDRSVWLERHAIEYTRLFIGPGQHVPPYESVHAPKCDNLLNNERTAMVRRFIGAAGFEFEPSSRAYPDHISIEFEFMEALISHQLASDAAGDSNESATSMMLQKEFILRHLSTWLPIFCDRILKQAEFPLYASLARITKQFMEMELEYLECS